MHAQELVTLQSLTRCVQMDVKLQLEKISALWIKRHANAKTRQMPVVQHSLHRANFQRIHSTPALPPALCLLLALNAPTDVSSMQAQILALLHLLIADAKMLQRLVDPFSQVGAL